MTRKDYIIFPGKRKAGEENISHEFVNAKRPNSINRSIQKSHTFLCGISSSGRARTYNPSVNSLAYLLKLQVSTIIREQPVFGAFCGGFVARTRKLPCHIRREFCDFHYLAMHNPCIWTPFVFLWHQPINSFLNSISLTFLLSSIYNPHFCH